MLHPSFVKKQVYDSMDSRQRTVKSRDKSSRGDGSVRAAEVGVMGLEGWAEHQMEKMLCVQNKHRH